MGKSSCTVAAHAIEAHGFFGLIAWFYYGCFLLLAGLCLLIACTGKRRRPQRIHQARLRHTFLGLALCLLLWQLTLFLETRIHVPAAWLPLGRLNFAVMVPAPLLALRFVQEVAKKGSSRQARATVGHWASWNWACALETALLAVLTLFTPWIVAAERVENGHALTTFGPLLPLYGLHVVGYWTATLVIAWKKRREARPQRVRDQLLLVGSGILITGAISLVTNLLLPYGWGEFRFCDMGPLSVFGFLLCVAYATFLRHLFALGIFLRETLIHGILLAFVLGAYSSAVFVASQTLTSSAGMGTQFAVLVIAFSFDPLRRFLEEKTDRLLFGERKDQRAGEKGKPRKPIDRHRLIALLFPWRGL